MQRIASGCTPIADVAGADGKVREETKGDITCLVRYDQCGRTVGVNDVDFSEWIKFEAGRIVEMGLPLPGENRADYMRIQIEAALRKAFAHGSDGLTETDPPRANW
ncbi:hypothetical protein BRAO375_230010 [Bradyrhizobium sp. ORS 375]|nr:hypothetical protein BRAO375_230010 [Bradyrhizobium sp. ORS 375]